MSDRAFLRPGEKERLTRILETADASADRGRAQILLGFEAGKSRFEIAEEVGTTVQRVLHWRREYLKRGLGIFGYDP